MPDAAAEPNRLIAYHSGISQAMTRARTALGSALIPVTAYILVSAAECWYRHPDIVPAELDEIVVAVRGAQAQHYRNVAAMSRDEKIACGAYVYFTFPRPFAEVAGVADRIDWTVPRDTKASGMYDLIAAVDQAPPPADPDEVHYLPIGEKPRS